MIFLRRACKTETNEEQNSCPLRNNTLFYLFYHHNYQFFTITVIYVIKTR